LLHEMATSNKMMAAGKSALFIHGMI